MAIPRMYCPECGNYLLNPVGDCNDCHCGYRQPVQPVQDEEEPAAPVDSVEGEK